MQLAHPTALLWFLLALPIVIFYMLAVRARRTPVSTVLFWNQVFQETRLRSSWRRLRHPLSLLVQLLFLALLVMAVAEPFFPGQLSAAPMGSDRGQFGQHECDGCGTQPARACQGGGSSHGGAVGSRRPDGDRLGERRARVVCGLTDQPRVLAAAIGTLHSTDMPGDVAQAVALGRRVIAREGHGQVVVITDPGGWHAAGLQPGPDLQVMPVGSSAENVAITRLQTRRQPGDLVGYQTLVEVTNFSPRKVSCRLEMSVGGELVDVVPLALGRAESRTVVLDGAALDGGTLLARIDVPDALRCDNQAVALLPRRARHTVVLVTEGNLFLQTVLEAIPGVQLTVTHKAPPAAAPDTLVVYHGHTPPIVPPGNAMFIGPDSSCDLWQAGGRTGDPVVVSQLVESPLMAHVELENVTLAAAQKLEFLAEHTTLVATADDEPLYVSLERPTGRTLVLNVNLDEGDLPLRTAFPILMSNAMAWFGRQQADFCEALATGSVAEVDLSGWRSGGAVAGDFVDRGLGNRGLGNRGLTPPARLSGRDLVLRSPSGQLRPLLAGGTS